VRNAGSDAGLRYLLTTAFPATSDLEQQMLGTAGRLGDLIRTAEKQGQL